MNDDKILAMFKEIQTWQVNHDETSEAWRKTIEDKLAPFLRLKEQLDIPLKLIAGALLLMLTPLLGAFGVKLFKWAMDWMSR